MRFSTTSVWDDTKHSSTSWTASNARWNMILTLAATEAIIVSKRSEHSLWSSLSSHIRSSIWGRSRRPSAYLLRSLNLNLRSCVHLVRSTQRLTPIKSVFTHRKQILSSRHTRRLRRSEPSSFATLRICYWRSTWWWTTRYSTSETSIHSTNYAARFDSNHSVWAIHQ